jgi:hypothetical protein
VIAYLMRLIGVRRAQQAREPVGEDPAIASARIIATHLGIERALADRKAKRPPRSEAACKGHQTRRARS